MSENEETTTSDAAPKKRSARASKRAAARPKAKRAAKKAASKKRSAKASSGKTVHTSGKEKNRFALNLWVTAAQKTALKKAAKAKGTSIVGMLRHALKLPE